MKFIIALCWTLIGPPLVSLTQALHVRLLHDWVRKPGTTFLHPQCTWKLAETHPSQGTYVGSDFYDWYVRQLAGTYSEWNVVVSDIIGSSIGGIVVGQYRFQKPNGGWCTAPFTHFYRIRRGQITDVRYFMGDVSRFNTPQQSIERRALLLFCSPN